MKEHSLFELADQAADKQRFLIFLEALRRDCIEHKAQWENGTIEDFLESIGRWIEEYHGDDIDFEKPDWRTIAAIFYMGRIYE